MHIKRMKLKKLNNTRDLGGMPADGGVIKKGKLIRSGKLNKITPATVQFFKDYGVSTVVDLRIFTETENAPDILWEGLNYVHLPVLCTATTGITHDKTMRKTMEKESVRIKEEFGSADNYMTAMYRAILFEKEPKERLARALRLIIENEQCILWHCSGGKDRAGIVAMLVESLLGVPEKVIIQDYIASRRFQWTKFFWNRVGLVIAPINLSFKRILYGLMAAKKEYLWIPMKEIEKQYGSVTEYCKKELGVTDEDIANIKNKYIEKKSAA